MLPISSTADCKQCSLGRGVATWRSGRSLPCFVTDAGDEEIRFHVIMSSSIGDGNK